MVDFIRNMESAMGAMSDFCRTKNVSVKQAIDRMLGSLGGPESVGAREDLLFSLCWSGEAEGVRAALARGEDLAGLARASNVSFLMAAVKGGHAEVVRLLLGQPRLQVNLGVPAADGEPPLHPLAAALVQGDRDVMAILLRHPDIQVNAVTLPENMTVLQHASKLGDVQAVRMLLAHPQVEVEARAGGEEGVEGETPLLLAVHHGRTEVVEALLGHPGVGVNTKGPVGMTALHYAIRDPSQLPILRRLLEHPGIDTEALVGGVVRDTCFHTRFTVLAIAVKGGKVEAVRMLVAREQVNLDIKSVEGESLEEVALREGHPKVVKLIQMARKNRERKLIERLEVEQMSKKELTRLISKKEHIITVKTKEMEDQKRRQIVNSQLESLIQREEEEKEKVEQKRKIEQNRQEEKKGKGKGRNSRKRKSKQAPNFLSKCEDNTSEETKYDNVEVNVDNNTEEDVKTLANELEKYETVKEELKREILEKHSEVADGETSAGIVIKEKSIEMADLILNKEQMIEDQIKQKAKLSKIEEAIKCLEREKVCTLKDLDHSQIKINKVNKKKDKLEQFIDCFKVETKNNAEKLHKKIKELENNVSAYDMKQPSGEANEAKSALEEFMERQVAALEEELECPVCLEVLTTSPLYKCADDHLICPGCRPKVARCPQCRETYPRGELRRFRGAERQAERLVGLNMERQQLLRLKRGVTV